MIVITVLVITLNVNGWKRPNQNAEMIWLGKHICCLQEIHCKYKDINSLKVHSSKYIMVNPHRRLLCDHQKNWGNDINGYENVSKIY